MSSFLWYDCETTGLSEHKNDIIQIACVPVINGIPQKPFNEYCKPINWNAIDQAALDIHGITVEQMKEFQSPESMLNNLIEYLLSFKIQFVTAGFNVGFDKKFLYSMFKKLGKNYDFFQLFLLDVHDTYIRAKSIGKKTFGTENLRLSTLCDKFNIEINAHEALSDIYATIELDKQIADMLNESKVDYSPSMLPSSIELTESLPEPAQLHIHSQFSMSEGTLTPEKWIDWCLENNSPGLSVTDHGTAISLYRAIRFKEYIASYNKKHGTSHSDEKVVGIPGLGIYFKKHKDDVDFYTLTAWAVNNVGYFNLMQLSSIGYSNTIEVNKKSIPIVTLDDIVSNSNGLLFGTGCVNSYVGKAVEQGNSSVAESRFHELITLFGDKLYVEFIPVDITHRFNSKLGFMKVQENSLVTEGNLQKAYNLFLSTMVDKYNAMCVPTTSAFFIDRADKIVQDCLQKNGHKDGFYFQESYHQRTSNDLYRELKVHLGDWLTIDKYKKWVKNTHDISNMAKTILICYDFHLPRIDIPTYIKEKTNDYNKQTLLYLMSRIRHHGRWNDSKEYKDRFMKEIDVIFKNEAMNFIPYFLVYEDLGVHAREMGFLQNIARGSAGGSLVSYYLKIIHVDPVKAGLPFERFLSHARIRAGSWPDIDMDISKSARPHMMKYLKDKYGDGFAQISTFSTMKTKNAIKDAFWALYQKNRKDREIEEICKTIPDSPQGLAERDFLYGYTDREGERHEGEIDRNQDLRQFFQNHPDIQHMVDKLIGTVRGWSRHPSAFVISTVKLKESRVPTMIMHDKHMDDDIAVTQYEAKMVESSGLVKADLLGLKTLSAVTDAVKLIKEVTGIDYLKEDDNGLALLYRLPEDDNVYSDFYNKKTDSSFQFNTPVVKANIQDFAPTRRSHNMALTALLRPGAMDAKMTGIEGCEHLSATEYYIEVRNGKRKAEYIHPDLEYILKDSNAIMCYQEEVMQFLVEIVGYTLEESDVIRSAIAKKKHDVMMASFDKIRESTSKRGWNDKQQDAICNAIMAFSRYSFNKSHSYAYAELGYITMYLKHHHYTEWWTAVLNNEDDEDKLRLYISLLGDKIKPPSMKSPTAKFKNVGDSIIAPISIIKSVGPKSVSEMVAKGPFDSLEDFCARIDHRKVNIGVVGQMVKSRAADVFMRNDIPYTEARLEFMSNYKKIRGKMSTNFKVELFNTDPLNIFLMEKETNQAFNKSVLSDKMIVNQIIADDNRFVKTNKIQAPLMYKMAGTDKPTLVINGESVARGLITKEYNKPVNMILLYRGSRVKKGISKRNRPYVFTAIDLSDGISELEAIMWDNDKPMIFPDNAMLCVTGTLSTGWKANVSITIDRITKIGENND